MAIARTSSAGAWRQVEVPWRSATILWHASRFLTAAGIASSDNVVNQARRLSLYMHREVLKALR